MVPRGYSNKKKLETKVDDAAHFNLALPPGFVLAERYAIDGVLAATSSFALTYTAHDLVATDLVPFRVVIKEFLPRILVARGADGIAVRPHSPADERDFGRAVRSFLHEGDLLSEIPSASLAAVHRCIEANGTGYVVMDHCVCQPLATAIAEV